MKKESLGQALWRLLGLSGKKDILVNRKLIGYDEQSIERLDLSNEWL